MPICTVFFDFGNVFATFSDQKLLKNLSAYTTLSHEEIVDALQGTPDNPGIWRKFEVGHVDDRTFHKGVIEALGAAETLCDPRAFARAWTDIFLSVNHELEGILSALKQNEIAIYLLSNCDSLHYYNYFLQHPFLLDHIPPERHLLSFEMGARKPERSIYDSALRQAKAKPAESLFIDDLPENIAEWEAMGGHGLVYHAGKDPIGKLKDTLQKHQLI